MEALECLLYHQKMVIHIDQFGTCAMIPPITNLNDDQMKHLHRLRLKLRIE